MSTTHECPGPGCAKQVPFEQLACLKHWSMVYGRHRTALNRLWRDDPGSDEYFAARRDCLLDMGVPADEVAELNAGVS